jgi:hypothetical protein
MTGKTYSNLKRELCKQDSLEISDSILKRIQKYPEWDMTKCYKSEENEGYEIFVDETLKNNIAGYGIFCKKDSKYNYFSRVEGEQTLQNATYQKILHVLKGVPNDEKINFILDRKGIIDIFEKFPKTYREKQNSLHLDTLL